MRYLSKIIRTGNENRITRFHTLRGDLIPKSELLSVPIELIFRLVGRKRKGPWLSKPAVREISRLLRNGNRKRVLEIGGGRSTKFFSEYASFLMTVEENPAWAAEIRDQISKGPEEFELINTYLDHWLTSRTKENMDFDIVLIDGGSDEARKKTLEFLPTLNTKAIYILDNSDRAIFNDISFPVLPTRIIRYSGLIRHPFQATETSFYFF